ncbi:MAG: hypothetical protein DMF77_11705 [Acidobacteria bacterium]|nr:MAG: hypothetical protein DMF77_11705 [Acidobacteriota bacterium]
MSVASARASCPPTHRCTLCQVTTVKKVTGTKTRTTRGSSRRTDGAAAESLHAVHVAVIEGELEYEHGDGDSRGEHAVVHVSLIAHAHGESDRGRQRQQDGLDQDEDRPAAAGEWSPAHAHSNGRVIGSGPSGRADG